MKRDPQIEDQIEAYLSGRMNSDEQKAFEKLLSENSALNKMVRNEQLIKLNIRRYHRSKIKNQLQQIHDKTINRSSILKRSILAAAAVLIPIIVFFYFTQQEKVSSQELYAQYYTKYSLDADQRGKRDITTTNILDLYNSNSFEAIVNLTEVNALNNIPISYRLILGISYLELGDTDRAKVIFQNIIDKNDIVFHDQAIWYKALAELKSEEIETTKKLLFQLVEDQSSDHHINAKNLLESLE